MTNAPSESPAPDAPRRLTGRLAGQTRRRYAKKMSAESAAIIHAPEPPGRRRLRPKHLLLMFIATIPVWVLWVNWRVRSTQVAVEHVRRAGFEWYQRDFTTKFRDGWTGLFNIQTWIDPCRLVRSRYRALDLAGSLDAIAKLDPTHIDLCGHRTLRSISEIEKLAGIRCLDVSECASLRNVDALRQFKGLQVLNLSSCGPLDSVDVLRELRSLKILNLAKCSALRDMEVLRGLKNLENLNLTFCTAPVRVDVLAGLKKLQVVYLNMDIVTPAQVAEIKAALPKTKVDVTFRR